MRYVVLLIIVAAVIALELLADYRPFPGIWWTHRQVHLYGGLILIAAVITFLLVRQSE